MSKALQYGYIEPPTDDQATLNPDEPITREEAIYILAYVQGWGSGSPAAYNFKDHKLIEQSRIGYIGAAINQGVVEGYPDGTIRPKEPLSRAEVVTMLAKYQQDKLALKTQSKTRRRLEDWHWSFANSIGNFKQGAMINPQITDMIYAQFLPSDASAILSGVDEEWDGACFGFATTVGLYNAYLFDVKNLNESGTDNISLIKLEESYNPQSAINAFQASWSTGSFQGFLYNEGHIWARGPMEKSNNSKGIAHTYNEVKAYLDDFKAGGSMPILSLYWMEDGYNVGHAVAAYDYKEDGDKLEVFLYDPNFTATSIVIDKGADRIYGSGFATNADEDGQDLVDFHCLIMFDAYGFGKSFGEGIKSVTRYLVDKGDGELTLDYGDGEGVRLNEDYEYVWNINPDTGEKVYAIKPVDEYKITSDQDAMNMSILVKDKFYGTSYEGRTPVTVGNDKIDTVGPIGDFEMTIANNLGLNVGESIKISGNTGTNINLKANAEESTLKGDNLKGVKIEVVQNGKVYTMIIDEDTDEVHILDGEDGPYYEADPKKTDNNNQRKLKKYKPDDSYLPPEKPEVEHPVIDDNYIAPDPNNPQIGSWYGLGYVDGKLAHYYLYLKENGIATSHVILADDPDSEFYTEQDYDYFSGITSTLQVQPVHNIYGQTGYFEGKLWDDIESELDLGTWYFISDDQIKQPNIDIYRDKF